jgi:hypothetical protein
VENVISNWYIVDLIASTILKILYARIPFSTTDSGARFRRPDSDGLPPVWRGGREGRRNVDPAARVPGWVRRAGIVSNN